MDDNLERAILRVDTETLIKLWDIMDRDIYRLILLVNIDNLFTRMNSKLFQHLSQVFITHEYTEVYNKIFIVNRFHEAIDDKDFITIKDAYVSLLKLGISENILLVILSDNLDCLLKHKCLPINSLLATYFCKGPFIDEYNKVCKSIYEILNASASK